MAELSGWLYSLPEFLPLVGAIYMSTIWCVCAFAYLRNVRLAAQNPRRRDYHPLALLLAPFSLPFLLVLRVAFSVLRVIFFSIMFGLFLILFPICLIVLRSSNILMTLFEYYENLGRRLLNINMRILRLTGLFPAAREA